MNNTHNTKIVRSNIKKYFCFLMGICICSLLYASVLIIFTPAVSFASETKTGVEVVLPNMTEFMPMVIAFIILAIVLTKFGWPKFETMLDKRKSTIEDALKDSENKRLESEKLLEEYKQKLKQANIMADEIVKDAKVKAQHKASQLENEAKIKIDAAKEKAKLSIENNVKTAQHEIKTEAVDIAVAAIAKFVSNDLTDDQHRQLIEKYVREAGNLKG